ncbi:hypothetical protein NP493_2608g00000 [Ridgeia piscesae]|uniref:Uncharacterized protein n=1 Tax=Ridgeia piscesae TaxID=27915 RepID=A0AAD9JEN9_RIDPI|nr:hypothetical protein NP493_2608g00000 [Ridgeia piscesae]
MKTLERLVLQFLKSIMDPLLDQFQFAYRNNISVDDAVALGLFTFFSISTAQILPLGSFLLILALLLTQLSHQNFLIRYRVLVFLDPRTYMHWTAVSGFKAARVAQQGQPSTRCISYFRLSAGCRQFRG